MKKTNIFNDIITYISPCVEELIRNICTDLDNKDKIEEMLEKYLYDDKVKTLKNLVKKKTYSMFLAHNNIRKNNNDKLTLKEYNKLKGNYWKNITFEEKNGYQKMADKWNMENMPYKMGKLHQLKKKEEKKEKNQDIESLFDNTISSYQQVIVEI